MAWIFALGIIALAVFHRGFRMVLFWIVGVALVLGAGVASWTLYRTHESNIKRMEAHATLHAKENAFRLALSRYCSPAEIGQPDSRLGVARWIPDAVQAGASPAALAQVAQCAGGNARVARHARALAVEPSWGVQVELMNRKLNQAKDGGKPASE